MKVEDVVARRERIRREKYKAKNEYTFSNALGSTFWMNIDDFCKYFYILTIAFTNKEFIQSFCIDQCFSFKWCCFELTMPSSEKDCYFSLF